MRLNKHVKELRQLCSHLISCLDNMMMAYIQGLNM